MARIKEVSVPLNAKARPLFPDAIGANVLLAAAYVEQGESTVAIKTAAAALDEITHSPLRVYYQSLEADATLWLGEAQRRAGNSAAAKVNLQQSLKLRKNNENELSPRIALTEIFLANCLLDLNDRDGAVALQESAAKIEAAHRELGNQYTHPLAELELRLLSESHRRGTRTSAPRNVTLGS
jgi:tetratricopeptide (TPR) repeat protein